MQSWQRQKTMKDFAEHVQNGTLRAAMEEKQRHTEKL